MPINPVQAAEAAQQYVRTEFLDTYRKTYEGVEGGLAPVMTLGIGSDRFKETYVYPETAPYPRRVPAYEALQTKSFRYRSYDVVNYDWAVGVEWLRNMAIYDQTDSLERQSRSAGENFATLPERIFFQIVQQTTDGDLLPAIPNAPDGSAIYANNDGAGNDRFGVSNGNLLSGSGVGSSADIRTDFYAVIEQFGLFQDTEGEPLHAERVVDGGVNIYAARSNTKVFQEAFLQERTIESSTTPTNIILDSGQSVNLHFTQRITDNDWYVFLNQAPIKAVFEQVVSGLEEMPFNVGNSDKSREMQVEGTYFKAIRGYGVNLPYQTIKVNN